MKTIILSSYDNMFDGSVVIIYENGDVFQPKIPTSYLQDISLDPIFYNPNISKLTIALKIKGFETDNKDKFVLIENGAVTMNLPIKYVKEKQKPIIEQQRAEKKKREEERKELKRMNKI